MARAGCRKSGSLRAKVRTRAFSLVELMIVVTIIALMVGILLPSLKRSIRIANSTVCMHNLREVGQSLHVYRIENDGFLPNVTAPNPVAPVPPGPGGSAYVAPPGFPLDGPVREVWFLKLFPNLLPDLATLSCPDDPYRFRMAEVNKDSIVERDVADYSSYGINGFIMLAGGGYLANLDRYQPTRPLDTLLLADAGPDFASATPARADEPGPKRNDSLLSWDDAFDPAAMVESPWVTKRHGAKINALTIVGGVREIRTEELTRRPVTPYYANCAGGGCTFCNELNQPHYSFAADQLYWWTGPVPAE